MGDSIPVELVGPAIDLAIEIADSAAISDIECFCQPQGRATEGGWWNDTTDRQPDTDEFVEKALAYLRLRNLLADHPTNPGWVRITRYGTPEPQNSRTQEPS